MGGLMNIYTYSTSSKQNVFIIGPSKFSISDTRIYVSHINFDLISIYNMNAYIIGPVILSANHAISVIQFQSCNVSVRGNITFKLNNCYQLIKMSQTFIKVMEYSNITLIRNKCSVKLITSDNEKELYPLCIFQFMALNNATVSPEHYTVNIIDNFYSEHVPYDNVQEKCLYPFYYFTPHCKWIPNAAFHDYDPQVIHHQIINFNNQNFVKHKICHCAKSGSNNCSVDMLGPVYPGQILQVELCTPCNDEPSTLYAEVNSIHLPDTACKIAPQINKANIISNYSKQVNFSIVSEASHACELFLTASSHPYYINEAFYIQLLPCPTGFTLQNGVCNCDPVLFSYIDTCYIDYSAIRRPANTWITAITKVNNTNYLISDYPMDYCLPIKC